MLKFSELLHSVDLLCKSLPRLSYGHITADKRGNQRPPRIYYDKLISSVERRKNLDVRCAIRKY